MTDPASPEAVAAAATLLSLADHQADVLNAVHIPWRIEFEGHVFREADLTLFSASKALTVAGGSWRHLHPLNSPGAFCGLLAAFLETTGENFDAALARVAALTVVEAVKLVKAV